MSNASWVVIKFGGNSVADLNCWQTIADITNRHLKNNLRILIVCSALAGITNKLELLVEQAIQGDHRKVFQEINDEYLKLAGALSVNIKNCIEEDLEELSRLAYGISLLKEASAPVRAKILAFGEIILTKLGAHYLQNHF